MIEAVKQEPAGKGGRTRSEQRLFDLAVRVLASRWLRENGHDPDALLPRAAHGGKLGLGHSEESQ